MLKDSQGVYTFSVSLERSGYVAFFVLQTSEKLKNSNLLVCNCCRNHLWYKRNKTVLLFKKNDKLSSANCYSVIHLLIVFFSTVFYTLHIRYFII